jgi:hypothetical protein
MHSGKMVIIYSALWLALVMPPAPACARPVHFDSTKPGLLPSGWLAGITGPGQPQWAVTPDPSAPSAPHVLKQSAEVASHSYPWCVDTNLSLKNGFVEVKFKSVSGKEDQAGGVVWRWQDGDNYYIARGNALEDNIILFRTEGGVRKELHRVPLKVTPNQWHTLRVNFYGSHITVTFDGQKAMDWDDDTFTKAGAAGVWTKADSVMLFDDFQCDVDP